MRFADITGLEEVKKRLFNSYQSDHMAHAQLFQGKQGSANLALALAFAALVNCENPVEGDACGQCASCSKNQKYIHPDVHFVFPVSSVPNKSGEKKEAISQSFLPEWRQFLLQNPYGNEESWSNAFGGENKQLNISKEESRQIIKNLSLKSFEGKYKVMIIWLAEYLHPSAANGILKILEEPPENTLFLLVTYDSEQLLGTILSRTQIFNVPSFSDQEVIDHLIKTQNTDEAKARQLASLASGNLNEAVRLLSEIENDSHDLFRNWMRLCYSKRYEELVKWTDSYAAMNKVAQKSLIQYGLNMLREMLLVQNDIQELRRISYEEESEFVTKFANTLTDESKIERIFSLFSTFLYHLERNINVKIAMLDTSLKINSIIRS